MVLHTSDLFLRRPSAHRALGSALCVMTYVLNEFLVSQWDGGKG